MASKQTGEQQLPSLHSGPTTRTWSWTQPDGDHAVDVQITAPSCDHSVSVTLEALIAIAHEILDSADTVSGLVVDGLLGLGARGEDFDETADETCDVIPFPSDAAEIKH